MGFRLIQSEWDSDGLYRSLKPLKAGILRLTDNGISNMIKRIAIMLYPGNHALR
jgi:hypothetical protein